MEKYTLMMLAVACYVVTVAITSSHILEIFRMMFRGAASYIPFFWRHFVVYSDMSADEIGEEEYDVAITDDEVFVAEAGYDFISCRLCVGFWVCLIGVLLAGQLSLLNWMFCWGFSYFMAKIEKN